MVEERSALIDEASPRHHHADARWSSTASASATPRGPPPLPLKAVVSCTWEAASTVPRMLRPANMDSAELIMDVLCPNGINHVVIITATRRSFIPYDYTFRVGIGKSFYTKGPRPG